MAANKKSSPKRLKPLKTNRKLKKTTKPIGKKAITRFTVGTSKAEQKFGEFMKSIGIEFETQFQLSWKFYDFIIKETRILIEFDGSYWHGDPALYKESELNKLQKKARKNDKLKNILAERAGYELIRIWEKDFNDSPDQIRDLLLHKLNKYRNKK